MKFRSIFNKLESIGKKNYICRNGEEALIFTGDNIDIEIYRINSDLDLVIKWNEKRCNFMDSPILSFDQKQHIKSILQSNVSIEYKCNQLNNLLLKIFNN